jgi:hypothetical protein
MVQFDSIFPFVLIGNSLLTIIFILNQNQTIKDSMQTVGSFFNPLEPLTWIGFIFQLILLLAQIKITDF